MFIYLIITLILFKVIRFGTKNFEKKIKWGYGQFLLKISAFIFPLGFFTAMSTVDKYDSFSEAILVSALASLSFLVLLSPVYLFSWIGKKIKKSLSKKQNKSENEKNHQNSLKTRGHYRN